MPAPVGESSPAEPKLVSAVVVAADHPDSACRSSTGPSPVMPSLSPYPLAGEPRLDEQDDCENLGHSFLSPQDKILDRRKPAKKMLDFGDTPLMQRDDEVRPALDGEHSLESARDREALSPKLTEERETVPELNPTDKPPCSQFADPGFLDNNIGPEITTNPSPGETTAIKRPHSLSPGEIDSKRPCKTSLSSGDFAPFLSPATSDELPKDLKPSGYQAQPGSPSVSPKHSGEDSPSLDLQGVEVDEARDPEDIFRCHGINLFENSTHRQELISFCELSLNQTKEYSAEMNNNNNSNGSDAHHHRDPTAHDKLESVVQRARARGFQVSDAVYFDGKQYVPIKVAANGRGKFRLLLPTDHPHRRGVAEEIPIFTMSDFREQPRRNESRD